MKHLNGSPHPLAAGRPRRRRFPHPAHEQVPERFACAAEGCSTPAVFYPTVEVGFRPVLVGLDPLFFTPATPLCERHAVPEFWFDSAHALAGRIGQQAQALAPSGTKPDWDRATFGKVSIQTGQHPHPRRPEQDA